MRFRQFIPLSLLTGLLVVTLPASAQVVPSYSAHVVPLSIGIGPSSYDVDWGHGRMLGGTVWADWYPAKIQSLTHLRGLGVEIEARDISLNRNLPAQTNMRQDTLSAGPIFSWHATPRFRPYFKGLLGDGSVDFSPNPGYSHDTRTVASYGGGLEYRFWGPLKFRSDYEYQFWIGKLFHKTLNPQGFTIGVAYDLSYARNR